MENEGSFIPLWIRAGHWMRESDKPSATSHYYLNIHFVKTIPPKPKLPTGFPTNVMIFLSFLRFLYISPSHSPSFDHAQIIKLSQNMFLWGAV
jgi:hypothetical protein